MLKLKNKISFFVQNAACNMLIDTISVVKRKMLIFFEFVARTPLPTIPCSPKRFFVMMKCLPCLVCHKSFPINDKQPLVQAA
jgi:hypothetical protein